MKKFAAILFLLTLAGQSFGQSFGWKSNPRHSLRLRQLVHDPEYRAAPVPDAASVKQWMPAVKNQENLGACTAFAGVAAFESGYKRAHGRWVLMSPLDLYQQNLQHDGNFPHDVGSYNSTTLWVLKNSGVCTERLWPYDTTKLAILPPQKAVKNRVYHTATVGYDVPNDDNGLSVMRCIALLKRGVIAGGYVYADIYEPKYDAASGKTYIPMPRGRPMGGHAIVYISYDKNLVINGIKGWVEFQNSWTEAWGGKGCAWMPMDYAFNPRYMEDFCTIQKTR